MLHLLSLWNTLLALVALALYLATLVFVVQLLLSRKSPASTWAWTLAIVFLPYLGALAYLFFGHESLSRPHLVRRRRRLGSVRERLRSRVVGAGPTRVESKREADLNQQGLGLELEPQTCRALLEASLVAERGPAIGNRVELLEDGNATFAAILAAIDEARHHVHVEYYVFRADDTGRQVVERLAAAARRGIEVRLLLDAVGTFYTPKSFFAPVRDAGGEVAYFMPVRFVLAPTRTHLRNHRKLVIIDGTVGFTGGVNVGDEYRGGEGQPFFVWADVFVAVRGPAVVDLQEVFVEDWLTGSGADLSENDAYFPSTTFQGDAVVQIISSGPDERTQQIQTILFAALVSAEHRAWLTTPYFAPTEAVLEALKLAALRGVDVRLLCPSRRTNHPLVFYAGRWYYRELLEAGVRIFEYQPGLVHAKLMAIDGEWSSVGSANMDFRSFRLNFELNALLFSRDFTASVESYYLRLLVESREIRASDVDSWDIVQRLCTGACRLIAPVL